MARFPRPETRTSRPRELHRTGQRVCQVPPRTRTTPCTTSTRRTAPTPTPGEPLRLAEWASRHSGRGAEASVDLSLFVMQIENVWLPEQMRVALDISISPEQNRN